MQLKRIQPKTIVLRQRVVDRCEAVLDKEGNCAKCPYFRLENPFLYEGKELEYCGQSYVVDGTLRGAVKKRRSS